MKIRTQLQVIVVVAGILVTVSVACAGDKKADLAGMWYPSDPLVLRKELQGYMDNAHPRETEGRIIALLAPHAGYRFSGPVAAYAYKAAMGQHPDTVVVVGFTHRKSFRGVAVFTEDSFVTPLGKAVTDKGVSEKLIAYDKNIFSYPEAFDDENSVEMEVPFVQLAFGDAKVALIAIGDQSMENCRVLAEALHEALKDEEKFLIVGSTDMCHYLPYDAASKRDKGTIDVIRNFDPDELYVKSLENRHELMCGYGAVYATMLASKKLGADKVRILKYANSGDTSGMKDRVVGYLSAAFIKKKSPGKEKDMFDRAQKEELLRIARDSIDHYLETGDRLEVDVSDEALKQEMGAFVTLHEHGQLRGCIGNMVARGPLYLAVRDMAIAAATEDPRFPPVKPDEMKGIDIEISVLSPMKRIYDYNDIEVGRHGVMVRMGWRSGVYLPQVAIETGWDRDEFMNSLCAHKAGIPVNAWRSGACEIYVFTAEVFGEKEEEKGK